MAERKRLATQKGGMATRKILKPLSYVEVENLRDVVDLLATTINEVRTGLVEIRTANCIGYLSGHLIKAFEVAELEFRISRIEVAMEEIVDQ
ncbi:MAG: hypothetical protein ABH880_02090 [Patescibacteria group bacterium]